MTEPQCSSGGFLAMTSCGSKRHSTSYLLSLVTEDFFEVSMNVDAELEGRRLVEQAAGTRTIHASDASTRDLIHCSTTVTKREARWKASSASETATGSHL